MVSLRHLPMPILDSYEWQFDGACLAVDSEVFFSPESERGARRADRENRAKQVCAGCPVIDRCRAFALQTREAYGVWGGMSAGERHRLLQQHPLAS